MPNDGFYPCEIVVRAFGDEPVRLWAVGEQGVGWGNYGRTRWAVVVSRLPDQPGRLGWWPELAWPFDEAALSAVRNAFENGGVGLDRAWKKNFPITRSLAARTPTGDNT